MTRWSPLIAISDVEDSVSGVYSNVLRSEGYRVIEIPDKVRLLNLLAALRPDLIVTDIRSTNMDGLELLESVKATIRTRSIPVIVASAFPEFRAEALGLGARDFLKKPFKTSELIRAVRSALSASPWRDWRDATAV